MPVESSDAGMMVTGDAIFAVQAHARVGALALGIHGLGRPGVMSACAVQCGSAKRTKKGVLEDYVIWMYSLGGTLNAQWGTVERALGAERTAKLKRKVAAEND